MNLSREQNSEVTTQGGYSSAIVADESFVLRIKPGQDAGAVAPSSFNIVFTEKCIAGSLIGGIAQTQEMLDYCAEKNITADVEIIPIQKINEAFGRMIKGDVKYRFVIDLPSLEA